jgi:glycogen operon protein
MLHGGDELSRTQQGNNNAYCQDNELSWHDWNLDDDAHELLDFTCHLIALRRAHPAFHRRRFFQGRPIHGSGLADIGWFGPDGNEMTEEEWVSGRVQAIGMFLNGEQIGEPGPRGEPTVDASFLVLLNGPGPVRFRLPDKRWGETFELMVDTAIGYIRLLDGTEGAIFSADDEVWLEGRSVVVLRKVA